MSDAVPDDTSAMTDEQLLGQFESLGDNCEFGLVQRTAGIERLGFFRFNFAALHAVLTALDRDFADVGGPEQVEIYTENNRELMVRIWPYLFQYHTHIQEGNIDVEVLRNQQIKAIKFLIRKMLEDLRAAEKIFIRKGPDSTTEAQMQRLLQALRRHGPVTLLWVVTQDEAHPMGSVEVVAPGLLKGHIDRFAPYDDAHDFSRVWPDICRGAYRLWRANSPVGTLLTSPTKRAETNLIRRSEDFAGGQWQLQSHATAQPSDAVARLHEDCAVTEHVLLAATDYATGGIYGYAIGHGMATGSIYVASIWVWLSEDCRATAVGAVIAGFASIRIVNAHSAKRGQWQRVWVSARIPHGVASANPMLYVVGPAGSRVFSTCWKLELGMQPTDYEPPARPPPPPAPTIRAYRQTWLTKLAEFELADTAPYQRASRIEIPPLGYGTTDLKRPGIAEQPPQGPGGMSLQHPALGAYVLRDAVVHGMFGVVTTGERVVAETLFHLPLHRMPGAERDPDGNVRLPDLPVAAILPVAYHLLTCNLDNYFHWLLEGMSRFSNAEFHGFGALGAVGAVAPTLLLPPLDTPWKQQSFDLIVPAEVPRMTVPNGASVHVERLIYVPQLVGGGMQPHRALLPVIDRIRAAAYAALDAEPRAPWRKIFVSRADSTARVLVNEAELAAMAAAAGFETVVLGGMPVAEQVRLFAEATHIVAPHGAGLTNLVFCRPGAALLELHMDCYVQWAYRRLAALRGLRYGCVIGTVIPPRNDWVHVNTWRLDPDVLAAALADPRFTAPG